MLFRRSFVYVVLGFLLTVSGAMAQIRSGTITGGVTDPSHAAIPDAEVTVTNTATNISNTTRTTQAGAYTVPYLETGTYLIMIVKTGFENFQGNRCASRFFTNRTRGRNTDDRRHGSLSGGSRFPGAVADRQHSGFWADN